MTGILRWDDRFAPRDLSSWPVVIFAVLLTSAAPLFSPLSGPNPPAISLVSLSVGASLIVFGVQWIAVRMIERMVPARLAWWLTLLLFVLLVIARTMAASFIIERMQWGEAHVIGRVASFVPTFVLTSIITAQVTHLFRIISRERSTLLATQAQLIVATSELTSQSASDTNELVQVVRARLSAAFPPLKNETPNALLSELRRAIDEVVRPLSHTIQDAPATVDNESLHRRRSWIEIVSGIGDSRYLQPGLIFVLLIVTSLPLGIALNGIRAVYATPAGMAILCGSVWLMKQGAARLAPRVQTWAAIPITLLATTTMIPLAQLSLTPEVVLISYGGPFIMLTIITSGLSLGLRWQRDDAAEIARENAQLRWELARTHEQNRQLRSAVSQALHGTVQAELASAYFRLQRSVSADTDTTESAEFARARLAALAEFNISHQVEPTPSATGFNLLRDTWHDVADILIVDSTEFERIDYDLVCQRAVNDILAETCFNAIKHGNAHVIVIDFSWPERDVLRLSVTNDGGASTNSTPGLGSALLTDSSIHWQRRSQNGQTLVEIDLPYLPTV